MISALIAKHGFTKIWQSSRSKPVGSKVPQFPNENCDQNNDSRACVCRRRASSLEKIGKCNVLSCVVLIFNETDEKG
jgi:hypothetical protein